VGLERGPIAGGRKALFTKETVSFLGEIVGFGLFYSANVGSFDKKTGM